MYQKVVGYNYQVYRYYTIFLKINLQAFPSLDLSHHLRLNLATSKLFFFSFFVNGIFMSNQLVKFHLAASIMDCPIFVLCVFS